jgi:hypothetical protein
MFIKYSIGAGILLLSFQQIKAQDETLLNLLNDSIKTNQQQMFVTGTFKATHIINMQTVEAPAKNALNFIIQHRFGKLNEGAYNLFGLDNATLRLGLDYGITDRLTVGAGRSSYLKTFDSYLKYKLIRQTDGNDRMPVSVSLLGTISNYTQQMPDKVYLNANYRTAYTSQLLIARKFNRSLSIEITPTWLHYNLVPAAVDKNDLLVIGTGARMKLTNRMSINAEYDYLPRNQVVSTPVYNSFSLGWDIETGGHVFQLVFTNSQSMIESQYLAQTTGSWGKGDIYFGFNISRNFNLKRK